ncbi:hypothetical protein LIER_34973 [Lithospermum erythrorhizon]|uniref:Uncharacterized protein n=1 Tax=Lithospermum erythrorhizon TaxID=34254 RepID=A0AAV3NIV5_LITER
MERNTNMFSLRIWARSLSLR